MIYYEYTGVTSQSGAYLDNLTILAKIFGPNTGGLSECQWFISTYRRSEKKVSDCALFVKIRPNICKKIQVHRFSLTLNFKTFYGHYNCFCIVIKRD